MKKNALFFWIACVIIFNSLGAVDDFSGNNSKIRAVLKSFESELKEDPKNTELIESLGAAYYQLGNYQRAAELYHEALKLDPNNDRNKIYLGLSYLFLNRLTLSKELLEEAHKKDPRNPDVLAGMGKIAEVNLRYDEADQYYERALEVQPDNIAALTFLSSLKMKQKKYEEAIKIYEQLLSTGKEWVKPAIEWARLGPQIDAIHELVAHGNYRKAIDKYKNLIDSHPHVMQLYIELGSLYVQIDRFSDAVTLYLTALILAPNNEDLYLELGLAYLAQKNLKKSREILEKVIGRDPENATALGALGRIAELSGNRMEAQKKYEQALEMNPYDFILLNWFTEFLCRENKCKEAIPLYERMTQLDPAAYWIQLKLDRAIYAKTLKAIHAKLGQKLYSSAEKLYLELISKAPDNQEFYFELGEVYMSQQRYHDAIELYKEGLERVHQKTALLNALGFAYLANHQINQASRTLHLSLKQDKKNPEALAGLGRVLMEEGKFRMAENYFDKALKIDENNFSAQFYKALLKTKSGKYGDAARIFEALLTEHPEKKWIEGYFEKAKYGPALEQIDREVKKGNLDNAIHLYLDLITAAPQSIAFRLKLGQLYLQNGEAKKAIDLYQEGLEIFPDHADLKLALARTYQFEKNDCDAARIYKEVLLKYPEDARAPIGLAEIYALQHDIVNAVSLYESALESNPSNVSALTSLGELLMKQKEYAKAEKVYQKLQQIFPRELWVKTALQNIEYASELNDAEALENVKGLSFSEREDRYRKAIEIYDALLKKIPDNPTLYLKIASNYRKMDRYQNAIQILQKGLSVDPENTALQNALGFSYLYSGDLASAKRSFQWVLKNDRGNADAWEGLYLIDERIVEEINDLIKVEGLSPVEAMSRYEKAVSIYRDLIWKEPNNEVFYYRLALLYGTMDRYEDAVETLKQGLNYDPNNSLLLNQLGYSYSDLKDYKAAEESFQKVLDRNRKNPDAWAGMGQIAELAGHLNDAEEDYRRALSLDPNNVNALRLLSGLMVKQGKYEEAKSYAEMVLSLFPNEKWAQNLYESALVAPLIDQIKKFEEMGENEKAAKLYVDVIAKVKNNTEYYLALGNFYIRMKQFQRGIQILKEGLRANPHSQRLRTALGLAYIFNNQGDLAEPQLQRAYRENPKDGEALAGLGQVEVMKGDYPRAETLFQEALEISPNDTAALSFYADLLMQEKRYQEAETLYERLRIFDPSSASIRVAIEKARNGSLMDSANLLSNVGEYKRAQRRYYDLIGKASDVPDYYFLLGLNYQARNRNDEAIEVFRQGLLVDPENKDLWHAIAQAYMDNGNYGCSLRIFRDLLEIDPYDSQSWAGLGRLQDLKGCCCAAYHNFDYALYLKPDDQTALNYMAQGYVERERYFAAKNLYSRLMKLSPEGAWIRKAYRYACLRSRPLFTLFGDYNQEEQWDDTVDEWSALLQYYGSAQSFVYPINDRIWYMGDVRERWFRLKDLLTDTLNYYFYAVQNRYGFRRFLDLCSSVEASLGIAVCSPFESGEFHEIRNVIIEPTLLYHYDNPNMHATIGLTSELNNQAARHFETNKAKMIERYYFLVNFSKELFYRFHWGMEADWSIYNDFINNTRQTYQGWFEYSPVHFYNMFRFRYQYTYDIFSHVIPDYYTYAPEQTHMLQVQLYKSWGNYASLNAGYAHEWQTARSRFQQIAVFPFTLSPLFNQERQINRGFLEVFYNRRCFETSVRAEYSRESTKYTIWSVRANAGWRF